MICCICQIRARTGSRQAEPEEATRKVRVQSDRFTVTSDGRIGPTTVILDMCDGHADRRILAMARQARAFP